MYFTINIFAYIKLFNNKAFSFIGWRQANKKRIKLLPTTDIISKHETRFADDSSDK